MRIAGKLSFSLSTLCLFVVIVALGVSQIAMMRQLRDARAEIDAVRRKFGSLQIGNEKDLIHVVRIPASELPGHTYRMYIPPGHRYMLNLADAETYDAGNQGDPQPTQTVSMNTWSDGAEVVLNWLVLLDPDGTARFRASTESEGLFDERLPNWQSAPGSTDRAVLQADSQRSFDPDESIYFMTWSNSATKQGVVFWMEPLAKWKARERKAAEKASGAAPAP